MHKAISRDESELRETRASDDKVARRVTSRYRYRCPYRSIDNMSVSTHGLMGHRCIGPVLVLGKPSCSSCYASSEVTDPPCEPPRRSWSSSSLTSASSVSIELAVQ